jgi:hypothetical protein
MAVQSCFGRGNARGLSNPPHSVSLSASSYRPSRRSANQHRNLVGARGQTAGVVKALGLRTEIVKLASEYHMYTFPPLKLCM